MKDSTFVTLLMFLSISLFSQPVISTFSPTTGTVGDEVTISGSSFDATFSNNVVYFGVVKAVISAGSASSLTVLVPSGAQYAPITVVNTTTGLSVTSGQAFFYTYSGTGNTMTSSSFEDLNFTTSTTPSSVNSASWNAARHNGAIADFDGDGRTDLAQLNNSGAQVKIFRNQSTPGSLSLTDFTSTSTFSTVASPRDIAVEDLNGDGKLDIIVTNGSTTLSILINDSTSGSISFLTKQDFTVATSMLVTIADLDFDGKPEVITAARYGSTVNIYKNTSTLPGTTITLATVVTESASNIIDLQTADLNNDGKLDICVSRSATAGGVTVFLNTTSGSLSFSSFDLTTTHNGHSVICRDFNMDGNIDIISGTQSTKDGNIFQNNFTSGTMSAADFSTAESITGFNSSTSNRTWRIDIGDFNGDGKPDITTGDFNAGSYVLALTNFNDTGTGTTIDGASFSTVTYVSNYMGFYTNPFIGDMDNDGKPDAIGFSNNTIHIARNKVAQYFPQSTGDLHDLATWGINTDGTGSSPSSFSDANVAFVLDNRASYTLTDNWTVTNLNLDNGKTLDIENFDLEITNLMGYNSTTYVKTSGTGKLNISITNSATTTFPVGQSTYNPVAITNRTGSTDVFSIYVMDEVYANGNSGSIVSAPRVQRSWDIDKASANGGSGIDVEFFWNSGEATGITTAAMYHHSGTSWDKMTGTTASTSTSLKYTGYTGTFSPFAIGDNASPLPIELSYFSALLDDRNQVQLKWETLSETNNDYFEVMRSKDGKSWETIEKISGQGTSAVVSSYATIDRKPFERTSYYRLMQVDIDGAFEYSSIVKIALTEENQISIFPNPANTQFIITSKNIDENELSIYDAQGKLITRGINMNKSNEGQIMVNISNLQGGIYFIRYKDQTQSLVVH